MEIEVKTVKLSAIKLNPDNPRRISDKDMDRLVKSLQDFPEMMQLREIVVDETMTVLGGNMRTLALRKAGAKECTAKIVTGLTAEQKREFMVKDNSPFGTWDMDSLSSWDNLPLIEWGVKIPSAWATPPGEESILGKNFNQGKGQDEYQTEKTEAVHCADKFPVTFILDQSEFQQWEAVKDKIRIQDDKRAFLKIIGGCNA